mmetsp:Transcript_12701/g.39975  ORF Transcript_12701/g.39975 Transcript_12701/m.39975 type:complete len:209 (+) Transcript_12701:346-972(+)
MLSANARTAHVRAHATHSATPPLPHCTPARPPVSAAAGGAAASGAGVGAALLHERSPRSSASGAVKTSAFASSPTRIARSTPSVRTIGKKTARTTSSRLRPPTACAAPMARAERPYPPSARLADMRTGKTSAYPLPVSAKRSCTSCTRPKRRHRRCTSASPAAVRGSSASPVTLAYMCSSGVRTGDSCCAACRAHPSALRRRPRVAAC